MTRTIDKIEDAMERLDGEIGCFEDEANSARSYAENCESYAYDAKVALESLGNAVEEIRQISMGKDLRKMTMEFLALIVNLKDDGNPVTEDGKYVPRTEWGKTIADVELDAMSLYLELRDAE